MTIEISTNYFTMTVLIAILIAWSPIPGKCVDVYWWIRKHYALHMIEAHRRYLDRLSVLEDMPTLKQVKRAESYSDAIAKHAAFVKKFYPDPDDGPTKISAEDVQLGELVLNQISDMISIEISAYFGRKMAIREKVNEVDCDKIIADISEKVFSGINTDVTNSHYLFSQEYLMKYINTKALIVFLPAMQEYNSHFDI